MFTNVRQVLVAAGRRRSRILQASGVVVAEDICDSVIAAAPLAARH